MGKRPDIVDNEVVRLDSEFLLPITNARIECEVVDSINDFELCELGIARTSSRRQAATRRAQPNMIDHANLANVDSIFHVQLKKSEEALNSA